MNMPCVRQCLGFSSLLLVAACKTAPAPMTEPAAPVPAPAAVAESATLNAEAAAFDPGVQACTPHMPLTPGPGYPTWTTDCTLPALPPGYPVARPVPDQPWRQGNAAVGPLNVGDPKNIMKLLDALKAYVAPAFNQYLTHPTDAATRPDKHGWRVMPWLGGADCDDDWSGADSSAGTSTGQVIPGGTLPGQKTGKSGELQNHAVTWYDPWATFAISAVFGSPTPGVGDPTKEQMPDGSVIVKIGALTPYADNTVWPPVENAPVWPVYRPPVGKNTDYCKKPLDKYELLPTRVVQFDIILKSSYYAPETQWVFATWLYDPNAKGSQPLDHYTALGAMWGNDPGIAQKDFCTPTSPLQQNWINPGTPSYGYQQLGWGCRLSGPIDVARRSAKFENGSSCQTARVSSCMSCHGSSEFPIGADKAATFYPLASGSYMDFTVYDPGSSDWSNWFQARAPTDPQGGQNGKNKSAFIAFDYDLVFVTSVPISRAAAGDDELEAKARAITHAMHDSRVVLPIAPLRAAEAAPPSPPPGCDCSCAPKGR